MAMRKRFQKSVKAVKFVRDFGEGDVNFVEKKKNLKYSRNGALPGPFGSPFGDEEVLELETSIFKLEKTIIAYFKDLENSVKMASLNFK